MSVKTWVVNMWNKLLGKELPSCLYQKDDNILNWKNVYQLSAPWLNYEYVTISGKKKRKRLTMNPAKIICSYIASLIFTENPIYIADDAVLDVLKDNAFSKNLRKSTEYMCALGGMAIKLYSDDAVKLDFVSALNFIPLSWDNQRVTEAAFIDRRVKDGKKYVRIETHKKHYSDVALLDADGNMVLKDGLPVMVQGKQDGYLIINELYEEQGNETYTKSDLGTIFPDIIPETLVPTVIPLFVYIKTPSANNYDFDSPLGVSTFANAIDTIQALDIAFDGLNSEILLGKKRIIVPTASIKKVVDNTTGKTTRYFDPSDEIYQALDVDDVEKLKIQDNSVELRIEEIKLSIQTLLDILSMQCGLSQGTLSYKDGQVKTATEVVSENSKTFKTKQDYENELTDGIVWLMEAIRAVLKINSNTEYSVVFSDSIIQDRDSNALYWQNRFASGTCTLEQALIGMDGLSDEDAKKQAELILGLGPVNTEETNKDAE